MEFFNNLSDSGIFFFCVVVFLVIFLLFLSIILINKNKKLKKMIENSVINDDTIDDNIDIINENIKDNLTSDISISDISIIEDKNVNKSIEDNNVEEEVNIDIKNDVNEESKEEVNTSGAYQKNVLREMSKKMPISPIHIERSSIDDDVNIYTVSNEEDDYGIDEIYLREDSISPLEEMDDSYEINDNMKFASDIIARMEEEISPSNIELTDYERKQEEEAIISYGELEKVKDKIYNLTLEEEDSNFIDELKNFRSDL